jgi:hypothetical protein
MVKDPGQEHAGNGHRPEKRKQSAKQPRASYPVWSSDLGFIPRGQPLPPGEAVRQLPRRYRFILTKPGIEAFLPELGLAGWKIVGFQLALYALVAALLAFLRSLLYPVQLSGTGLNGSAAALHLSSFFGPLLLIPLLFFFAMGVLYWLARVFGGHGIFVQQAYTTLLFLTPCGIFVSVLSLIPFAGSFLSAFLGTILFCYCVALQCFATVVVHQMSGGKATSTVVITVFILIPVAIACLALWTLLFVAL